MKLILTHEVTDLGAPGDIVEVKDGYGRNYLLPPRPRDPVDQGRREAGRRSASGRATPARSATVGHAAEVAGPARGPDGHQ